MKNRIKRVFALAIMVMALVAAIVPAPPQGTVLAEEQSFVFTDVDFPGAKATRVFGINAGGDMVGQYVDASNVSHGFALRVLAKDSLGSEH